MIKLKISIINIATVMLLMIVFFTGCEELSNMTIDYPVIKSVIPDFNNKNIFVDVDFHGTGYIYPIIKISSWYLSGDEQVKIILHL